MNTKPPDLPADVQLGSTGDEPLLRYERGLPRSEVKQATLGRFLPGSLLASVALILGTGGLGEGLLAVAALSVGLAGVFTLGFGLGLLGLRRWLYPDANITGRRSLLAGLLSPPLLFTISITSEGLIGSLAALLLLLIGPLMALGMFFAWLTPTPEDMRPPPPHRGERKLQ